MSHQDLQERSQDLQERSQLTETPDRGEKFKENNMPQPTIMQQPMPQPMPQPMQQPMPQPVQRSMQRPMAQAQAQPSFDEPAGEQDPQQIRQKFEQLQPEAQYESIRQIFDAFINQLEEALGPTSIDILADVVATTLNTGPDEDSFAEDSEITGSPPVGPARSTSAPPQPNGGRQLPDKSIF